MGLIVGPQTTFDVVLLLNDITLSIRLSKRPSSVYKLLPDIAILLAFDNIIIIEI